MHNYSTMKWIGIAIHCFNKKAFQSNATRPLSDNPHFLVNKFEHVWLGPGSVRALHSEVQVEQVWKCRGGGEARALYSGQNDTHDWKHFLPATSLAASKKMICCHVYTILNTALLKLYMHKRRAFVSSLAQSVHAFCTLMCLKVHPTKQ